MNSPAPNQSAITKSLLPMGERARLVGVDPISLEAIVWKSNNSLRAAQASGKELRDLYWAGKTPTERDSMLRDAKGAIYHQESPSNRIIRVDGYSVAQPSEIFVPKKGQNLARILNLSENAGYRGQGVYVANKDGSSLSLFKPVMDGYTRKVLVHGV